MHVQYEAQLALVKAVYLTATSTHQVELILQSLNRVIVYLVFWGEENVSVIYAKGPHYFLLPEYAGKEISYIIAKHGSSEPRTLIRSCA